MEVTVTSFSQTPLGIACERAQTFAANMMLSTACYTMCIELSHLDGIETMRQLKRERPETATTLAAILLIMEDRKISC